MKRLSRKEQSRLLKLLEGSNGSGLNLRDSISQSSKRNKAALAEKAAKTRWSPGIILFQNHPLHKSAPARELPSEFSAITGTKCNGIDRARDI